MKEKRLQFKRFRSLVALLVIVSLLFVPLAAVAEDNVDDGGDIPEPVFHEPQPEYPVSYQGVEPVFVEGNNPDDDEHKVEYNNDDDQFYTEIGDIKVVYDGYSDMIEIPGSTNGGNGGGSGDPLEVFWTVSDDLTYLSWMSKAWITLVILKGGQDRHEYHYLDQDGNYILEPDEEGWFWDSWLVPPRMTVGNPSDPNYIIPEISHFNFYGQEIPESGGGELNGGNGGNDGGQGGDGEIVNGGGNDGGQGGTQGGELNGVSALGEFIVAPEAPATDPATPLALPSTGGTASLAIALGLLLAGSGILIKRKNS